MARPPELWAFVLANTGLFLISSVLTTLSYVAYRQSGGKTSYALAVFGFGFIVLGGLVEPTYQLIVRGDYHLTGTELLWLQAGETVLIAVGLGLLFYAITHHRPGSSSAGEARARMTDQSLYDSDYQRPED